jgi:hypothetical protein
MPKTPLEITVKVREIFDLARASETPISILSLQSTILLGNREWEPEEVERVSSEVLMMLIRQGWKGFHPT